MNIFYPDKYMRPAWLEKKLYTRIGSEKDLFLFTSYLKITKYYTTLDVSGNFTVFASTNNTFNLFFQKKPHYGNRLSIIPQKKIIKFHINKNNRL